MKKLRREIIAVSYSFKKSQHHLRSIAVILSLKVYVKGLMDSLDLIVPVLLKPYAPGGP